MENFITLKQLSDQITSIINQNFTSSYWVLMDIQKLNLYRTGHAYPELVEKDEKTNKIVAQMHGIIWSSDFLAIQRKFMQVLGTEMKDGIRVLAKCLVTYHPVYGLSLRILDVDTTYSQGILEQERLLTIKKLKEEGIYDANKKIPFPLVPQRIAIISIETSKGFKRFLLISMERLTSFCANKIVCVSPSIYNKSLVDKLNPKKKQIVIGKGTCGGIDTRFKFNTDNLDSTRLIDIRKQYSISDDDFVIGYCGRLVRDKGIIELVNALKYININCKIKLIRPVIRIADIRQKIF